MLPNDSNNPNNTSSPPPFGSTFNPNVNPPDPNNPYSSHYHQVQSELASHRPRDVHGRFLSEHPSVSQTPPTIPNPPNSNPSFPSAPSTPQVIHNTSIGGSGGGDKGSDDEPLFEAKINNPFSKFFNWIKSLIKNEGIKITIKPLTAIAITMTLTGGGGVIGGAIVYFFPHNSPILHREVVYQGNLQKTDQAIFLTLPNSDLYTLRPKAKSSINFASLTNGPVLVKGNLTVEKFVIDAGEIIPLNSSPQTPPNTSKISSSLSLRAEGLSEVEGPNTPNPSDLPKLYTGLTWESSQKRVLVFTSGKRRIDVEGFHVESAELKIFPQDFINYYLTELKNNNFKETLNSIDPEGITITYAKDELFLTFGIKNIYQGKGDRKQLTGYKAFIEHN